MCGYQGMLCSPSVYLSVGLFVCCASTFYLRIFHVKCRSYRLTDGFKVWNKNSEHEKRICFVLSCLEESSRSSSISSAFFCIHEARRVCYCCCFFIVAAAIVCACRKLKKKHTHICVDRQNMPILYLCATRESFISVVIAIKFYISPLKRCRIKWPVYICMPARIVLI